MDSKPSLVAIFLQNYNSIHQQIVFFYLSAEQLRFAYPVANFPLFFVSLYAMNKNLLFFFFFCSWLHFVHDFMLMGLCASAADFAA